jgi:competence protein ComEA
MDAVFAAGGFTKGADQASINLARPLNDGEQILVASLSNESAGSSASASTSSKLVNLNRADASALDSLPGIGPTLAQRIMDYRQANGGFRSINDLGKVAGIGPSLLAKLQNLVTL